MRVIAGTYGGRVLRPPKGESVRPTSDRVKESLFNMLSHRLAWDGCVVCDLYAGSGSLGIEALSRGAASVCFVERDRTAMAALKDNLRMLSLDSRAVLRQIAVETFLSRAVQPFDLILADPPYACESYDPLLRTISDRRLLTGTGLLVIEHSSRRTLSAAPGWETEAHRVFGDTAIAILVHRNNEESPA